MKLEMLDNEMLGGLLKLYTEQGEKVLRDLAGWFFEMSKETTGALIALLSEKGGLQ